MERATKLLVVACTAAALAMEVWVLAPSWPSLATLTFGAFAATAVLTAVDRRAVAVVLVFAYVYPALIATFHGIYHIDYDVIWMGALLGAIVPDSARTPWHFPAHWRGPLVFWALVAAVSTAIVVSREADFYPRLLVDGVAQRFVALWVLHGGLTILLGILWFDWLFGASLNFSHAVVTPLVLSCLALATVSAYQAFVDISFLNANVFGGTGRASGTTFDANVSGALAAFWTGGAMLWAASLGRWRWPGLAIVAGAAWIAVWASGSRTALLAASISSGFGAIAFFAQPQQSLKRRLGRVLGIAAIAAGIMLAVTATNPQIVGPAQRLEGTLPQEVSLEAMRWFANQMWDRNGYGSVATEMIRDYPWFGIGISSFQLLLPNYTVGAPLPPDNAQNWFRHQLVEFGLIGSVGWIVWVCAFAWFAVKPRSGTTQGVWVLRGMLIGFAATSFLGMPAQAVPVTITFWTAAFWLVEVVGVPRVTPLARRGWIAVTAGVLLFAAGSLQLAATQLRVPMRAQRSGASYAYGFSYPEPDGSGGEYRWARQRASMVIDAKTREMVISVSVNHHDVGTNPVDVKVWVDGDAVLRTTLRDTAAVTKHVTLPHGENRTVIDTWVSRVVRPADLGVADARELGLMVGWSFLPESRQ
jgi:hypothetical protein